MSALACWKSTLWHLMLITERVMRAWLLKMYQRRIQPMKIMICICHILDNIADTIFYLMKMNLVWNLNFSWHKLVKSFTRTRKVGWVLMQQVEQNCLSFIIRLKNNFLFYSLKYKTLKWWHNWKYFQHLCHCFVSWISVWWFWLESTCQHSSWF